MRKSINSIKRQKELQEQLDNIYEEKAEGAFIRSRYKWLEQGEKNTKYFFLIWKNGMVNLLLN